MKSAFSVEGKTALITGGARRLGEALALFLSEQDMRVIVHYYSSEEEGKSLVERIRASGREAWGIQANLNDQKETTALFSEAIKTAGPVDLLINNASIYEKSSLTGFTVEELHAQVGINAFAPLLLGRAFAAQKREGVIINLLDAKMHEYEKEYVTYNLSKRLLLALTRMMAVEFAPLVRVNAVAPGLILPPAGEDENYLKKLASSNPLRAYGDPRDICDATLFLARSVFMTGQVIYVDGGRHLSESAFD